MSADTATYTMLFSDIEGSTRLLQQLGARYPEVLERHQALLRGAFSRHGGEEQGTEGDSFFVLFRTAASAVDAAVEGQLALAQEPWVEEVTCRVRIGLHTGAVLRSGGSLVGMAIHEAARISAATHGGQVVVSDMTRALAVGCAPGTAFVDLGPHRLKDIPDAMHLHQIGYPGLADTFPPLRSQGGNNSNLPAPATSFMGRERELRELVELLGHERLVTITGAGGSGKTRLALRAAAGVLGRYPGGVWFVDLAPHTDRPDVVAAVLEAMGRTLNPGTTPIDQLVEAIGRQPTLLVLDNCEHLVEAVADAAGSLLTRTAEVSALVTTREPLGAPGEAVWRLGSLSFPTESPTSIDELLTFEAPALFASRALSVHRGLALGDEDIAPITAICRQLDGIPLALELAAARCQSLPIVTVAERLDQRFRLLTGGSRVALPRHRTLAATVDWSYDLLDAPGQLALRRAGVFAGGFTLAAAEAVLGGDGIDAWEVLDLVDQLVAKSLLIPEHSGGEPRYRMLETIRHYAIDKLLDAGEMTDARRRHVAWCHQLVDESLDHLTGGGDEMEWLDRVNAETANLRLAIDWALEADPPAALALVARAWPTWLLRDYMLAGLPLLRRALAEVKDPEPVDELSACIASVVFADELDPVGAVDQDLLDRAHALAERVGDRAPHWYGTMVAQMDAFIRVEHLHEDPKSIADELAELIEQERNAGNDWDHSVLLYAMTLVQIAQGQHAAALRSTEEAWAAAGRARSPLTQLRSGQPRAYLLLDLEGPEAAILAANDTVALATDLGDEAVRCEAHETLAKLYEIAGDHDRAEAAALESLHSAQRRRHNAQMAAAYESLAAIAIGRGDPHGAAGWIDAVSESLGTIPPQIDIQSTAVAALGAAGRHRDAAAVARVVLDQLATADPPPWLDVELGLGQVAEALVPLALHKADGDAAARLRGGARVRLLRGPSGSDPLAHRVRVMRLQASDADDSAGDALDDKALLELARTVVERAEGPNER